MSPIVPHSLVSYAAGLIDISFLRFTLASFVGFLPPSAAYTYVGAVLGRAVRTSAGTASHDPVTWTFYGLGLVATLAVTVLTTRMARQSWKAYYGPQTMAEEHVPETTKPAEAPGAAKVVTGSLSKSYRLPNGNRSLVRRR
jgi:SNARE associated Golgi protein